jgi:hypothetical protein
MDGLCYRRPEEIDLAELRDALNQLQLFGNDPSLRMHTFNLAMVDQFATKLEDDVRKKFNEEKFTLLPEATFLSAQSHSIAKHEVSGRKNSVALMSAYGRIDQWCGALDFELENGFYSIG